MPLLTLRPPTRSDARFFVADLLGVPYIRRTYSLPALLSAEVSERAAPPTSRPGEICQSTDAAQRRKALV